MEKDGRSVRGLKQDLRAQRRRLARKAARGADDDQKSIIFVLAYSILLAAVGAITIAVGFRLLLMIEIFINPALQRLVLMLGFIIFFLLALMMLVNKYMPKGWMVEQEQFILDVAKVYKPPQEKFGSALTQDKPKFTRVFDDANIRPADESVSLDKQDGFSESSSSAPPGPDDEKEKETETETEEANEAEEQTERKDFGGPPPTKDLIDENLNDGTVSANDAQFGTGKGHDLESVEVSDEIMAKVLDHLKFLIAEVTQVLESGEMEVDNYTKFGLNLFFAGACARLTKAFTLSANEGMAVLARLMELTGVDKAMAYKFADNINEYGERPQYRKVVDAGDTMMKCHLEGEFEQSPELRDVLEQWKNSKNTVELPSIYTFMFTDIVDSTGLTEELGNFTMRKVIRTHNKHVREALERYGGTEVKHTGDGIMATFHSAKFAIDAAVQIQQDINLFSRKKPKLGFDVRIGIHQGEAVMEDDDYFGTAVQTTARICAEAGAEEIWISEEIERACWKDQDRFVNCGEFNLKGLSKEITLYSVSWNPIPDRTNKKVAYGELGGKKRKRA